MAQSHKNFTRLNYTLGQFIIYLSCIGLMLTANLSYADITIEYSSTEESENTGFYDDSSVNANALGDNVASTVGEARRNVMEAAVAYWNSVIEIDSDISIYVTFNDLTCAASGYVVGSSTNYSDELDNTSYPRSLYLNKTQSSGRAMRLKFNDQLGSNISTACKNASWYYGLEQDKPDSTYVDLYYTVKHEIGHGLGIAANAVNLSNGQLTSSNGGVFVNNLLDLTTNKYWNDADMTQTERNASISNGNNSLVWGGEEVKRILDSASLLTDGTNSGYPIMYAPGSYLSGSSVSHFDTSLAYNTSIASGANELMEPNITDSEDNILTVAALTDIGWTVTLDSDDDGTSNPNDAFPFSDAADTDTDADGKPDDWLASCDASCQDSSGLTLDNDDDADGITDGNDNCPVTSNANQADLDDDGTGDACDLDGDNDGVLTAVDNCPLGDTGWTSTASNDVDGDGCQDSSSEENDYDNDGVDDSVDSDPTNANVCSDNDKDGYDDCRTGSYDTTLDSDVDADGYDYDVDVDNDGDGLIEIYTLAQLDAMRNDLAGSSLNGDNTGCNTGCNGYELMNDLDFDTDGSGTIDSEDDYWNEGKGWEPVGTIGNDGFTGNFDGNGYSIANLYIDRSYSDSNYIGLFGYISGAEIRNVGLTGSAASVIVDSSDYVGTLIGLSSASTVSNVFSTIDTNYTDFGYSIGGLIGQMLEGSLTNAYTSGSIRSEISNWHYIGGVVGLNDGGTINAIYSIASVLNDPEETPNKGGALVGLNTASGTISDSYWNTSLTPLAGTASDSNNNLVEGITITYQGLSTTDMKCPQSPADSACNTPTAFQNWSEDNWDFGTSTEYPALSINGIVYREVIVDEVPTITAPADQTVEATGSTTEVNLGTASATDPEDGTLTATADNTGPFSVGTHTITWSATDSAGNTATATQSITIQDTTAPTITAPADQTVEATAGTVIVITGTATATDLVDDNVTISSDAPPVFGKGTTIITWTATDDYGNTATAKQTIIVSDTTAPTVNAPADKTIEATGTLTAVELGTATAFDAVDTVIATAGETGPFSLGTHIITWSATDTSGNTGTDTQTLIIQDTTAPTISDPAPLLIEATSTLTTVDLEVPDVSDLVDSNPEITASDTGPFAAGEHVITWTATDASGNSATATQLISILDTGSPIVTAPADRTVEATGVLTAVDLGVATVIDDVDDDITATADNTGPFALGTHIINWSAFDDQGNEGTDSQTIIVEDTTAPFITPPEDITVESTGTNTSVDVGTASAFDLVDGDVEVTSDSTGSFTIGTHTITWTAVDNSNNVAMVNQTVIITEPNICGLDIDGDSTVSPLSDGLLLLRYLFGFTGDTLIDSAVSATAERSSADDIVSYLSDCINYYDIDGDGEVLPLSDGLLVLRYEFGFSGATLIDGVISASASRTDATSVESYFETLISGTDTGTGDDENIAPVANAGSDQSVSVNDTVSLDGSNSSDVDGNIVSYSWAETTSYGITLVGADTATPSFTADNGAGSITLRLTVTDDSGATASDNVNITVSDTSSVSLESLGEKLYFDTSLSVPAGQSCASCHTPDAGFADPDSGSPTSLGADNTSFGTRNAPTASYAAHIPDSQTVTRPTLNGGTRNILIGGQFLDGRAASLEEQAKGPFLNPVEMANESKSDVIDKIKLTDYASDFETLFGVDILEDVDAAYEHVAEAIAAFERSSVFSPFTSKFDQVAAGTATFTAAEARGQRLFNGRAQCNRCHTSPDTSKEVFSNFEFKNIGVPGNNTLLNILSDSSFIDNGLGDVTGNAADNGKFRTPNLRNIANTAPYMHNGVFSTLTEVVEFYNTRDTTFVGTPEVNQNVDQGGNIGELGLTDNEIQDLVSFLETLTDE